MNLKIHLHPSLTLGHMKTMPNSTQEEKYRWLKPILTAEEKYLLLESGAGERIFFAEQKHVSMKVIAFYAEDQLIITSPEEILKIKMAKEE